MSEKNRLLQRTLTLGKVEAHGLPRPLEEATETELQRKAVVGKVVNEPVITLKNGLESRVLFDFKKDKITGIGYQPVVK